MLDELPHVAISHPLSCAPLCQLCLPRVTKLGALGLRGRASPILRARKLSLLNRIYTAVPSAPLCSW